MSALFDSIRKMGFRRGPKRMLGGVAGGLASKMKLNVWLVRLLVLIAFLLPVVGWVLYFVIWIITPWQDGSIPLERLFGGRPQAR